MFRDEWGLRGFILACESRAGNPFRAFSVQPFQGKRGWGPTLRGH